MRDREFLAIPVVAAVVGFAAAMLFAADQGVLAWVALGVATLCVSAVVVWVVSRRHRHPAPADAPAARGSADPTRHHVLLVADESCTAETFVGAVTAHAGGRPVDAFVIAPALGSRLARWTGDDGAYAGAQKHLDDAIGALRAAGIPARGRIGAHDPLQAADDALREYAADEVVFAVHRAGAENWLEKGVVEAAATRYSVPVSSIEVEP
jgi:hypothetical protein